MRRVRRKDTEPELAVRRYLHAQGFRFRLHRKDLPGTPDIVLPSRKVVVFVHGCFWHRHHGCRKATMPKSRVGFWAEKFEKNKERDRRKMSQLRKSGWRPIVIWQCETEDVERMSRILRRIDR